MSHTTTSITRRVYNLKVKAERGPRKPQPSHPDAGGVKRIPLPPLFQSTFRQPAAPASRSPRSRNWKWAALASLLSVALFGAIYLPSRTGGPAEKRLREKQQSVTQEAPTFNMRPMHLASPPRSAPGNAHQASAGADPGKDGSRAVGGMSGDPSPNGLRPAPAYAAATDDDKGAPFDGPGKLVLPSGVSGACNIGDNGSKDLRACLVQNGARAE